MWSGMLPELLDMISRKYVVFYEDYLTFARVCKSWYSTAVQGDYSNGLPSRFPSLLLANKAKDEIRELFLLSNKSIRKIQVPETYGKICRSSRGWLVTVGHDHAAQLINPLTRETINLPKVDAFDREFSNISKWYEGIRKLLIVTDNPSSLKLPLVVVSSGSSNEMGFCRPGDKMWTTVDDSNHIGDITYYNRKVYTIHKSNYSIEVCDVHGENHPMLEYKSSFMQHLYDNTEVLRGSPYIIGLDEGERKRLLVVIRDMVIVDEYHLQPQTYKTRRFQLFAFYLDDERWSSVKDLGKKTLFVGHSSTFWVEDTTGVIKSNCIYFTDDVEFLYNRSRNGGGRDMGIYHLSNGTIEPHFVGESRSFLTPPIWLESMSSCGWLINAGRDRVTQLINPLSRATINLPKLDTFDDPEPLWLSGWSEGITKLLVVTNYPSSLKVPLVVVLWGCFSEMGFCRPGDNKWTSVGCSNLICDITYYNGQVYTFDKDYRIRACDVHGDDPPTLVDLSTLTENLYDHKQDLGRGAYIVGLDEGEKKRLLVVIKYGIVFESLWLEAKRFILFAYDLEDGSWSRVYDLGNKTLFLGRSSSFWVEDTTGVIKRNCIYYADVIDPIYTLYFTNNQYSDMGIYHVSNGTIEPLFTRELCNILTHPMWLESI